MSAPAVPGPALDAPPFETVRVDRCRVCGGSQLVPLALRYEFRQTSFPLLACLSCGVRLLGVQPSGGSLAALYSAEYFDTDFRCGRSEARGFDESAFRAETAGLLDAFARLRSPGRLLEIGCAAGWLLLHARERGWSVRGVELSAAAVAHARGLGLEVDPGTIEQAALPANAFDLAYLGDVLEHVPDPRSTMSEVARVLVPGGHVVLRGPITTNSIARRLGLSLYELAGRSIVLREPPYHLWEHTPGSLRRLFRIVGLDVIEARQSKIPPGRAHGRKTALEGGVMAAIDALNLPLTRAWNVFGDRIQVLARKR
jgi:SAM-dependent methyltransferase